MLSASNLASIESEGRRLVRAVRQDPTGAVPQYPGWSLSDLASHTASIHGRTVLVCRQLPTERISAPRLPEGRDPIDWYEETLDEMLAALREADPETPVWSFDGSGRLGFWERRMVVETGVHRWDAYQAIGEEDRVTDHVASEGLDEFGEMWLHWLDDVQTLEVVAIDLAKTWFYGEGEATASVEGSASDLLLRLMSRPSPAQLPEDWATAVDGMAPPPKR